MSICRRWIRFQVVCLELPTALRKSSLFLGRGSYCFNITDEEWGSSAIKHLLMVTQLIRNRLDLPTSFHQDRSAGLVSPFHRGGNQARKLYVGK